MLCQAWDFFYRYLIKEIMLKVVAVVTNHANHQRITGLNLPLSSHSFRRLEREKHEIEQEFAAFRREVRLTSGGSAVKDIRALKAMVKNLEDQLLKEKTRNQRATSKRSNQYRDLLEEVVSFDFSL